MKKIFFILFIFFALFFNAQVKNSGTGSGNSIQNMVTTLKHDTCLNKKFSIVFYIVLDSNYSVGAATPANLNTMVVNLNTAFKPICVQFLNCSTVFIPQYPYDNWTKSVVDPVVTANYYTDKTINVYITNTVTGGNNEAEYAYPPPASNTVSAKDAIVLTKASLISSNSIPFQSHIPIHQFGHFFGLPHTFEEITSLGATSLELVNRTNCYINGDGFCDTEADPYPTGLNATRICNYLYLSQDANLEYYVPPVDNLMSLYPCRCHFTQEQYNFMAYTIIKKRLYLH